MTRSPVTALEKGQSSIRALRSRDQDILPDVSRLGDVRVRLGRLLERESSVDQRLNRSILDQSEEWRQQGLEAAAVVPECRDHQSHDGLGLIHLSNEVLASRGHRGRQEGHQVAPAGRNGRRQPLDHKSSAGAEHAVAAPPTAATDGVQNDVETRQDGSP